MILFVKLLLAHLLSDFLLQATSWVKDKEHKKHRSIYLYIHIILNFILAWILVGKQDFGWYALALAISHGFIVFLKLYFQTSKTKRSWFLANQISHLLMITAITLLYTNTIFEFSALRNPFWFITTAIILLTKPTSILIKNIISIWTPENKSKDESLQNAGNYIGILERLFVFCFILTDHFEAIGFLLAAKSIFRFGDLKEAKDRKLTEYVLIGTLLSFGIALLIGLVVQLGLRFSF
ncbi:Protein of unknown function [Flavobacterium segetis]|uniref:DUF3307 domain-containing protein n=1 Tax=Flavobacterium segetis TaxID=271157 RepID=A0A1M5FVG2_9FLAO|nr:DUF3307 domain-containing protein [Flavobacterium segetis]SHF95192.1 Protein of unknown function [Flavobacterium segetis]